MLCHLFSSSLGYESPRTVMLESPLNSTFAESMMHCIYIYIYLHINICLQVHGGYMLIPFGENFHVPSAKSTLGHPAGYSQ